MVGGFDDLILFDESFHFIFEKFLKEDVGEADIDTLLFFLELFTHGPHHHLLDFSLSLLPLDVIVIVAPKGSLDRVDLGVPFVLFASHRLLDGFQHVPAPVADLGLIELFLPQGLQFNVLLLEGEVVVEVPFPEDEDVVLESAFDLLVDVQVVDSGRHHVIHLLLLLALFLEVLDRGKCTFLVLAMWSFSSRSSSFSESHCFLLF